MSDMFDLIWAASFTVLGWFANDWFSRSSEKRTRKKEFRKFLGGWLWDIQRTNENDTHGTFSAYMKEERAFAAQIAGLDHDFWQADKFRRLCAPLRELHEEHISNYKGDCRLLITNPIESLLAWVP